MLKMLRLLKWRKTGDRERKSRDSVLTTLPNIYSEHDIFEAVKILSISTMKGGSGEPRLLRERELSLNNIDSSNIFC